MLDFVRSFASGTIDTGRVDDLSDVELDGLPFGVIGLDPEGVILRYNLYESRLARLDRNQVVGRNFFLEVARCTRTDAFEGRFRDFVAAGGRARDGVSRFERFDFVFDFRFGAQEVSIDIANAPGTERFYLLINRRGVSGPRPNIPSEILAAEQVQLAPAESSFGVRRDALERRVVEAPASLLAALRGTCDRLAPDSWQIFSLEWGTQWGRRIAVDLEADALEQRGKSLRELPMRDVASMIAAFFTERGWGAPTFDLSDASTGILSVDVQRSAIAEATPTRGATPEGSARADLSCHLLAGAFGAVLSAVAGRRLAAREVSCVSGRAPCCTFVIIGQERRDIVDQALRGGVRGLASTRTALAGVR